MTRTFDVDGGSVGVAFWTTAKASASPLWASSSAIAGTDGAAPCSTRASSSTTRTVFSPRLEGALPERLATHSDARVRAAKQLLRKSAMPDTPVPRR
jgi:hypothetical protein